MTDKSDVTEVRITSTANVIGAQVDGVDLRSPVEPATYEVLEEALERYGVLVIPAQEISAGSLVEFSRPFGNLKVAEPDDGGHPEYPEILIVGNPPGMLISFSPRDPEGELEWHVDYIHDREPARISIMHALATPAKGGDTLFACMFSAYDALSPAEQQRYDTLRLRHSLAGLSRYIENVGDATTEALGPSGEDSVVWPLVRRHPRSGRKALYFGSHVSLGIDGQSDSEGEHFVRRLTEHATAPAFRYRHHWSVGDVVLWDNRRVLHAGTYYDVRSSHRLMHRTTIQEDHPIGYRST